MSDGHSLTASDNEFPLTQDEIRTRMKREKHLSEHAETPHERFAAWWMSVQLESMRPIWGNE